MSAKTIFQKIIDHEIPAEILHEDEFCVAFHDVAPQAPVHVLIVPKIPIPRVGETNPDDRPVLGHLLYIAGRVAEQLGVRSTEKGFRLVINHGRDGGESVPHLHVHLLAGRALSWPPG